jgi:ATP-binding cassette subfamily C (CFTR/MRP) protein 1
MFILLIVSTLLLHLLILYFIRAVASFFLYQILGYATFAGLGIMIISIPINNGLAVRFYKLEQKQMMNKDSRMKLMDEILGGIKVVKLYAW